MMFEHRWWHAHVVQRVYIDGVRALYDMRVPSAMFERLAVPIFGTWWTAFKLISENAVLASHCDFTDSFTHTALNAMA